MPFQGLFVFLSGLTNLAYEEKISCLVFIVICVRGLYNRPDNRCDQTCFQRQILKKHGIIGACDLTFDIHVFNDFVLVKTTSGNPSKCNYFNKQTTLDGFYLKIK